MIDNSEPTGDRQETNDGNESPPRRVAIVAGDDRGAQVQSLVGRLRELGLDAKVVVLDEAPIDTGYLIRNIAPPDFPVAFRAPADPGRISGLQLANKHNRKKRKRQ